MVTPLYGFILMMKYKKKLPLCPFVFGLFISYSCAISSEGLPATKNSYDTSSALTLASIKPLGTEQKAYGKIKKVNIRIHPIFDESKPEENNFLFRLANRLHIGTDVDVIKNDLLFKEGSEYNTDTLYESERILRTRRYLNRAKVSVDNQDDEGVDVNIDVNEVWTLVPTLGFSRSGGNNDYSFGFKDSNFLGYGKSFNITYNKSDERSGELFEYIDPNTGWHQTRMGLAYENNSDGSRQFFSFERPYFSLTTPSAGGVEYEEYDREESYYDLGDEVDTYRHFSKNTEIFYGSKLSLSNEDNVHRLNVGYLEQDDTFFSIPSAPNSVPLPQNRLFKITWAEHQYIQNNFSRFENIQQINQVEDINFGVQSKLRLGYVYSSIEEYDESLYMRGQLSDGIMLNENNILLLKTAFSGFYKDEIYNSVISARLDYHWSNIKHGQFYIGIKGGRGVRLFADQFLVMGGGFGLRGYPDNYQSGDKRYLINFEQRFYGQREWLSLFYMGAAIFYDEGRAWGNSASPQSQDGRLRDVGFGLRFSGTRNGSREEGARNVLHVDFAHPLDGDDELSDVEISVRVRKSF